MSSPSEISSRLCRSRTAPTGSLMTAIFAQHAGCGPSIAVSPIALLRATDSEISATATYISQVGGSLAFSPFLVANARDYISGGVHHLNSQNNRPSRLTTTSSRRRIRKMNGQIQHRRPSNRNLSWGKLSRHVVDPLRLRLLTLKDERP